MSQSQLLTPSVDSDNVGDIAVCYSGDTEENVVKLCQHANLSPDDRNVILAMRKLGVPVLLEVCLSLSHFLFE